MRATSEKGTTAKSFGSSYRPTLYVNLFNFAVPSPLFKLKSSRAKVIVDFAVIAVSGVQANETA